MAGEGNLRRNLKQRIMKRDLTLFAASLLLLCGTVSASAIPAAEAASAVCAAAFEQEVAVYDSSGRNFMCTCMVTASDNACSSYTIMYSGKPYRVSESDEDGFRYMFYHRGKAYYFNM